jgi:hypothetical protein
MSQRIPIYIPTFISSVDYKPARVLPHIYFYNDKVACEPFYIEHNFQYGPSSIIIISSNIAEFPYFDNYNVTGSSPFPSVDSKSLLFNNETAVYGSTPTASLYTEYYQKYVELLYNPKTRLFNCSAIIPFAAYNELTLNDIVEWRGNYYHLRAINEYSIKTGECDLQLLGPIIFDTFGTIPTPPQTFGAVSWSYSEARQDGEFILKDNGTIIADLTSSVNGNALISSSHIISASITPVNYPASSSVTMSLIVNGPNPTSQITYNQNTTLTTQFTVTSGSLYSITASIQYNSSSVVSGSLQLTERYGFSNSLDNSGICLVGTSSAWAVPGDALFDPAKYIFQDDQGSTPFPYKYVIDRLFGSSLPAPVYNYNSGSGLVGAQTRSCF